MNTNTRRRFCTAALCVVAFCLCQSPLFSADDPADVKKELEQLREQNRLMQQQMEQQRQMIDQLNHKVSDLQTSAGEPPVGDAAPKTGISLGNVRISGEGGVAFFESGKNGYYPNAEFHVDEARFFVDAPLWKDIYFYGELNLLTRETGDDAFHLGELYLDFQDLAQFWGQDHLLSVRAGRLYSPFGEEYQTRYAIDNPLISHSLSDLWAVDTGVEAYGTAGKFSYAMAVQNGGISTIDENTADKAVSGRLSFDPVPWLHLSASGMRTGDLSATADHVSALWFGDGFFHSIGSKATSRFHADLGEFDAQFKWHRGSLKTAGGYADYNDNDPAADNHRDIYYYYAELVQSMTGKLYGAVRFSEIDSQKDYPIVGNSDNPFGIPTTELWRLSLGLGYRFNERFLLKAEYMLEHGQQASGSPRNHADMVSIECAYKF